MVRKSLECIPKGYMCETICRTSAYFCEVRLRRPMSSTRGGLSSVWLTLACISMATSVSFPKGLFCFLCFRDDKRCRVCWCVRVIGTLWHLTKWLERRWDKFLGALPCLFLHKKNALCKRTFRENKNTKLQLMLSRHRQERRTSFLRADCPCVGCSWSWKCKL